MILEKGAEGLVQYVNAPESRYHLELSDVYRMGRQCSAPIQNVSRMRRPMYVELISSVMFVSLGSIRLIIFAKNSITCIGRSIMTVSRIPKTWWPLRASRFSPTSYDSEWTMRPRCWWQVCQISRPSSRKMRLSTARSGSKREAEKAAKNNWLFAFYNLRISCTLHVTCVLGSQSLQHTSQSACRSLPIHVTEEWPTLVSPYVDTFWHSLLHRI